MNKNLQAIRGMNDILPNTIGLWQHVEAVLSELLTAYGYQEIRLPLLEKTELFKRTIGEVTDVVEKEMYTFVDRDGESLTLRPEITAGCVRAGIEHGLLYNQIQRFWSAGALFRHERPQKGRYRQFYQVSVEAFGMAGPDIDAELIFLAARLWRKLKIDQHLVLQLNSLGSAETRANYRAALVAFCSQHLDQLDEDSRRRLHTNPLRILDSKNPVVQNLLQSAPLMADYLDEESKRHFEGLCRFLDQANVKYEINPRLVRGLDYYGRTVFEWVTTKLGAQGTVCAGGRYDTLVEQLGGKSTPAFGFAVGLDRIVELVEMQLPALSESATADIYLVIAGDVAQEKGMAIAEQLRDALPGYSLIVNCGGGKIANQFKRADKSGAQYAFILGDDELAEGVITLKSLRSDEPQVRLKIDDVSAEIDKLQDKLLSV